MCQSRLEVFIVTTISVSPYFQLQTSEATSDLQVPSKPSLKRLTLKDPRGPFWEYGGV
jgi:hypothetical protein